MILHHYELSPFSEKIRLMLGYCNVQWQSAISPAMPPRPIVDPLAGGYRRIPVAQIGADIFCDTDIITAELAILNSKPELSMDSCGEDIRQYAHYIDNSVFTAMLQASPPLKMLITVFTLFSPLQAFRFIKDRAGVKKSSKVKPIGQKKALSLIENHYTDMESKLKDHDFLFGTSPCVADFSAYHLLWFKHLTNKSSELEGLKHVNDWFQRMSAFGHGQRSETTKKDVFEVATNSEPRKILLSMTRDDSLGKQVEIRPNDYAQDAVKGMLVGSNESRWIIARETDAFGTLHVHFPKSGFELTLV